jgi:hypothetical protein
VNYYGFKPILCPAASLWRPQRWKVVEFKSYGSLNLWCSFFPCNFNYCLHIYNAEILKHKDFYSKTFFPLKIAIILKKFYIYFGFLRVYI